LHRFSGLREPIDLGGRALEYRLLDSIRPAPHGASIDGWPQYGTFSFANQLCRPG
jgi:hypothetical protein